MKNKDILAGLGIVAVAAILEKLHCNPEDGLSIHEKLDLIIQKQNQMANEMEDLTAEVSETKGIMASAKALIEGFSQRLTEAGTDKTKLAALKADLDGGSSELAAAIAANPLPGEVITDPGTGEGEPVV